MKSGVLALIVVCGLALTAVVTLAVFMAVFSGADARERAEERKKQSLVWQLDEFDRKRNLTLGISGAATTTTQRTAPQFVEKTTHTFTPKKIEHSTRTPSPVSAAGQQQKFQEEHKWASPVPVVYTTAKVTEAPPTDTTPPPRRTIVSSSERAPIVYNPVAIPSVIRVMHPMNVEANVDGPPIIGGRLHVHPPSWTTDVSITEAPSRRIAEEVQRQFESSVQVVNTNRRLLKPNPNSEETNGDGAVYLPPPSAAAEAAYQQDRADIQFVHSRQMKQYGKVVGLAIRNNLLYVPAHRRGSISVMTTPDLSILEELPCPGCRIYDLVVLSNGDLIVAQGKAKKLTKLNRKTKTISKEIRLRYATKGLAVGPDDDVYVMSRAHDKLYHYDSQLILLGVIPIPNESNDDCNFVKMSPNNQLYVSCQNQVYVLTKEGELVTKLKADSGPLASYSVGLGLTNDGGRLVVIRRGKAQLDVFDGAADGRWAFVDTIGPDVDTLWSDMEVAGDYAYVVDYLSATIRAIRFRR